MDTYSLSPISRNPLSLPHDFADELNQAQQEAVFFEEGPLLLIAGAGSGKTKTLTFRVARLVNNGVPPEAILLLTFTRKAANEMLERATQVLDNRCRDVSGGTFHAFGNILLRQYAKYIGYTSQFTIMDRGDAEDLINLVRKGQNWPAGEKKFPKKGTIASIISKSINTGKTIPAVIGNDFPQFIDFSTEIQKIAIDYQIQKKDINSMDYDDLLVKTLELLNTAPEVREELQNKYQYIMVDEYQDTNLIQAQVIKGLVNKDNNIMVVGDDSQSIYSFRGADFKNIMTFPSLFPGTTTIKLEQNYRSTQPILDLTNNIIAHAKEKFTKNLFTDRKEGKKPLYIEAANDNQQSKFICEKINALQKEGRALSDIAILMRSGWHSNDLELELKSHGLPFNKVGGFKFVESSHIKDVVAYLKVIYNPYDLISWHRVLMLLEGLGAKGAAKIAEEIKKNATRPGAIPIHTYKKRAYFEELQTLIQMVFSPGQAQKKPTTLLNQIMTYYTPIFKSTYDNFNKRQSDLDSLETISEKYDDLETMLAEMSLDPPTSKESLEPEKNDGDSLTLSTIHSAKGLEWDTVFLLSAVDGYLPSFQSLGDLGQLEEERRLMYVALTRAQNNLFIVKPNLDLSQSNHYRFSGIQFSNPSRFIEEHNILEEYTEQVTLKVEKKSGSAYGFSNNYNASSQGKKGSKFSSKPKSNWADKYNDSWANQELGESDFDDRRKYNF